MTKHVRESIQTGARHLVQTLTPKSSAPTSKDRYCPTPVFLKSDFDFLIKHPHIWHITSVKKGQTVCVFMSGTINVACKPETEENNTTANLLFKLSVQNGDENANVLWVE